MMKIINRKNKKLIKLSYRYYNKQINVKLKKPELPEDCCGNNCVNCVYDVYFKELEKYEDQKKKIKLQKEKIEAEKEEEEEVEDATHVDESLKAFREFEKKLKNR